MKEVIILSVFMFAGFASAAMAEKQTACYSVEGMTCTTCSLTIKVALKKVDGVAKVEASYGNKNAVVVFDQTKTNADVIKKKIDSIGYKATKITCERNNG